MGLQELRVKQLRSTWSCWQSRQNCSGHRGTAIPKARGCPGACCNCAISLCLLSQTVTLFPATLTRPAGSSATFICNISMENSSLEFNLNWYQKTNNSNPQKIAGIIRNIPQKKMEKYRLFNNTPVFKMEILNLHQNDSGFYYCGLITFSRSDKVVESSHSQLVVTGQPGVLVSSCGTAPGGDIWGVWGGDEDCLTFLWANLCKGHDEQGALRVLGLEECPSSALLPDPWVC